MNPLPIVSLHWGTADKDMVLDGSIESEAGLQNLKSIDIDNNQLPPIYVRLMYLMYLTFGNNWSTNKSQLTPVLQSQSLRLQK